MSDLIEWKEFFTSMDMLKLKADEFEKINEEQNIDQLVMIVI